MMRQSIHFLACAGLILSVLVVVRSQKPELIVQKGHTDKGLTGKFGLGGKLIVTAGQDHAIKLWNSETGTLLKTFPGFNPDRVEAESSLRISPDGRRAAAVDLNRRIRILDLETGSELQTLAATFEVEEGRGASVVHGVAASRDLIYGPDGQHLFALVSFEINSQTNYAIRIWDSDGRTSVARSLERGDVVPDTFSPDASLILGYSLCAGESKVTVVNAWDTLLHLIRRGNAWRLIDDFIPHLIVFPKGSNN